MLNSNHDLAADIQQIEQRLNAELRGINVEVQTNVGQLANDDLSSRELLQLAWDRAEHEIDELRTELRLMQQRHKEQESNLITRINHRKRLQLALSFAAHPIIQGKHRFLALSCFQRFSQGYLKSNLPKLVAGNTGINDRSVRAIALIQGLKILWEVGSRNNIGHVAKFT